MKSSFTIRYLFLLIVLITSVGCTNRTLKKDQALGITPEAVKSKIDLKQPILIIDVRSNDEYYSGHLPGAKLFPATDIFMNVHQLPDDKEIIVYCSDGKRSLLVAKHLQAHGFRLVRRLNGGIKAWNWEIER